MQARVFSFCLFCPRYFCLFGIVLGVPQHKRNRQFDFPGGQMILMGVGSYHVEKVAC